MKSFKQIYESHDDSHYELDVDYQGSNLIGKYGCATWELERAARKMCKITNDDRKVFTGLMSDIIIKLIDNKDGMNGIPQIARGLISSNSWKYVTQPEIEKVLMRLV